MTDATIVTKSVEETQQLGERLGAVLAPGDVVGLVGDLGAGKTTFIQGLARGLKLDTEHVKSPTFVLMREYPGRVPLVHMDGYRLENPEAAVWLDLEWLFSRHKVTVIEWADRLTGVLPEEYLEIRFAHKSSNQRAILLVPHGQRAEAIAGAMTTQRGQTTPRGQTSSPMKRGQTSQEGRSDDEV